MSVAGILLLSFLSGSVPFSNIAARSVRGVDLREVGGGTVSGTALYRVAGFWPLAVAGILDVTKGAIGPLVAGDRTVVAAIAGGLAVAGHNWSPFLRGAGGRGVAPALGALLVTRGRARSCCWSGCSPGRFFRNTGMGGFVAELALTPALAVWGGRRWRARGRVHRASHARQARARQHAPRERAAPCLRAPPAVRPRPGDGRTVSLVALVRRPGYRDLLVGQGVSSLGDWMGTVALMALVLELTNSPIAVGGILTMRLLPAAIGGPLAARAALRWDRRRTMLAMDATRAVMIALVPLVRALWWVYLWGFLVEVASIVFLPARDASIPDLVAGDDELPLANGLILGTSYGSIPIGAALFAAVAALPFEIDHRPYALVFFIDALTFLVSFFCIAGSPSSVRRRPRSTTKPTRASSTRSGSPWCAR